MTGAAYGSLLLLAAVLALVPGAGVDVVAHNPVAAGRARAVATANADEGAAAATGLGAVIAGVRPLFEAIRWAGVAYLAFLGVQALRSAVRGRYTALDGGADG